MAGIDAIETARPLVEGLREDTGQTAALFILRGHTRLCVLESRSPHVLAISRGIGETEHICRGASGKAILAFMTEDVAPILRTLPAGTDRKRLLADLAQVRRDGSAISRGEVFVGAIAIAAPYFDHAHRVAGSIGVFGPQARLAESWVAKTTRRIVDTARQLSAALGDARVPQPKVPVRSTAARSRRSRPA